MSCMFCDRQENILIHYPHLVWAENSVWINYPIRQSCELCSGHSENEWDFSRCATHIGSITDTASHAYYSH